MKPWQIGLVIVAAVVLGGSIVFNVLGGDRLNEPDRIHMIDVRTGDLYYASIAGNRTIVLPARNPDTKERTLYPVHETEEGAWHIKGRYRSALESLEGDLIQIGADGVVEPTTSSAAKYEPPPFD